MIDKLKTEFANFWQDTQGKIRAYMLCACGNPSDADDLVQQCYLRAFKNWEKYNGTGSRYAWLFRFASGLSYAEIAQTLDIPIGTVRSRLHRTLNIIHDKIGVNENE